MPPLAAFRRPLAILLTTAVWAFPAHAELPAFVDGVRDRAAGAASKVWHGAHDVAVYALGLIGVSYRFGGETPEDGLDCSGLVRHVFQQVTGVTLPRTAKEMSRLGGAVTRRDLQPGDLVFFDTRRFAYSHVGIYLGDNRFVHAPRTGRDVELADLSNAYWRTRFNGARRLAVVPAIRATAAQPVVAQRASYEALAFDLSGN